MRRSGPVREEAAEFMANTVKKQTERVPHTENDPVLKGGHDASSFLIPSHLEFKTEHPVLIPKTGHQRSSVNTQNSPTHTVDPHVTTATL